LNTITSKIITKSKFQISVGILNNHDVIRYNVFCMILTVILIVDDARFMRTMLKNILESAQLSTNIVEAIDHTSAIEMYNKVKPELVTMDINLPHTDGITCMKEILKINPHAKVLMVSAIEQKSVIDDAINSGAIGYIKKPFEENNVISTVKELLNSQIC